MAGLALVRRRVREETARLPEAVQAHIEAVRRKSRELAQRHAVDEARAEIAALAHDLCRTVKAPRLVSMARGFGISVTPIELAVPVFLHGPVGAQVLQRDYGLDDPDVLSAIACHTMGKPGMTPLDKVLFLADKLDPSKMGRYPFIAEVDRLALEDLDRAMLCFIDHQTRAFIDRGDLLHPSMAVARNEAILALKNRGRLPGR